MTYHELKEKHEKEFSAVPIFWAFSIEQLKEGLKKFNIIKGEKIVNIGGGGYMRKSALPALDTLLASHVKEKQEALKDDNFLIDAISYELGNHEFCITYDPTDTIEILDLNLKDPRTAKCFIIAKANYMAGVEY